MHTCFIISCEHGRNQIPDDYWPLFRGHESLLDSHRGLDFGALQLANALAECLDAALFTATVSRLLVDLNRSIRHPHLFSEVTRNLPPNTRKEILAHYYYPYRNTVETAIAEAIQHGSRVIHVSVHSFTPVLSGKFRQADIGLLYDPSKSLEHALCHDWQKVLKKTAPDLTIRRNYPYSGKADGFTAYLRRKFAVNLYAGIELEVNQKYFFTEQARWPAVRNTILESVLRSTQAYR